MAAFYFDSSALVKYYLNEVGSAWVEKIIDAGPAHEILIAHISGAELVAGITRGMRIGSTSAMDGAAAIGAFRRHFQSKYQRVIITLDIVEQAMTFAERYGLRGYDAVQLAGAMAIQAEFTASGIGSLVFVSADIELNQAAQSEGMTVENPNHH